MSSTNVSSWGWGGFGGLCQGSMQDVPVPTAVPLTHQIAIVSCSEWHCVLLTTDGHALSCGYGRHGALGHGNTTDLVSPMVISSIEQESIVSVATGLFHSMFLNRQGRVFTCGWSGY